MVNKKQSTSRLVFICILFTIMRHLLSAVTLDDGDWIVDIDEDFGNITNWENADNAFLFEHGFWYRLDSSSEEVPFNDSAEFSLTSANFTTSTAALNFAGSQFNIAIIMN